MEKSSQLLNKSFFPSDDQSSAAVALADGNPTPRNNITITLRNNSGSDKLVSDETRYLFELIVYTLLCGTISIFGIVTNVINILVFRRQGLMQESVTTTLTGLAVADLCSLTTMLWLSICYAIILADIQDLPWDPPSMMYLTAGWPHVMFTRVTCWITALVSFERCLCVVIPFKVKEIMTSRRVLYCIVSIFTILILTYFPIFYTHRLAWTFDPITNRTTLSLTLTEKQRQVEYLSHFINAVILPTACLATVMVCTKLTVSGLHLSKEWRSKVTSAPRHQSKAKNNKQPSTQQSSHALPEPSRPSPGDNTDTQKVADASTNSKSVPMKEKKIIRMVILICTIFLICNTPCILIIYLRFAVPEIANLGRYHNLFHVLYSIDFLLESFGSSINIFVYYGQSSKYKTEFTGLFALKSD